MPAGPGRALIASAVLASLLAGCRTIGAIAYYVTPHPKTPAEHTFPEGSRVAILIEARQESEANPIFDKSLHETLVNTLKDQEVKAEFVPFREMVALRQKPGYAGWSVQRIGREVGADQVLFIRLDRLSTREAPDFPVVEVKAVADVKVIGTSDPEAQARLWPGNPGGRQVKLERPAKEASQPRVADEELTKSARVLAREIARFFYEHDPQDKLPIEP